MNDINNKSLQVTPNMLARIIAPSVKMNLPVMIWGPPAVGKSAIVRQFARDNYGNQDIVISEEDEALLDDETRERECYGIDSYFVDIRAMLLDPVDLPPKPSPDVMLGFGPES